MKVFVYDKEFLVRDRLERIVGEAGYEVVARGETLDPMTVIQKYRPQILLLSKQMDNLEALCAALTNAANYRPAIILIGDKDVLAVDVLGLGASAYLVSPVSKEDLSVALARVCQPNSAQEVTAQRKPSSQGQEKRVRQYIAARTHRGVELISLNDVYYFSADQKYVKARHKGGMVLIDETLKDLEQEFAGIMFRIHRNALVNLDYLDLLESVDSGQYQVRFRGLDEALGVSRRHLPGLREKIYNI
ncbi:MAG: LytTR family DNA-binding domain-containing protein [Moraxella sp.]|nr:LytTR family DNA-binding domain-containing protein [Moraxella sp.]